MNFKHRSHTVLASARISRVALTLLLCLVLSPSAFAQFKEDAFKQSYNDDPAAAADSVDMVFSFKEFFGGIKHTEEPKIGTMFAGSMVFVGAQQMYNRDYWKLPLIYSGLASTIGAGIWCNKNGHSEYSKYFFIGAGLIYWGTLMDGCIGYKPDDYPLPGEATIYSLLCPGLGQIYNHEGWKLPIYWGGMIGGLHFYLTNKRNYNRFRNIYMEATNTDVEYTGPIQAETAKYYRDVYRRYRDYSVLTIAGVYVLQIIDANVFAYMHDFEITDDVACSISPTVLLPDTQFAVFDGGFGGSSFGSGFASGFSAPPALGMRLGFSF